MLCGLSPFVREHRHGHQAPSRRRPSDERANPLRKFAIEEQVIDPAQVHPNIGDTLSGESLQQGSSCGRFNILIR
jgi:hypothetical protein